MMVQACHSSEDSLDKHKKRGLTRLIGQKVCVKTLITLVNI